MCVCGRVRCGCVVDRGGELVCVCVDGLGEAVWWTGKVSLCVWTGKVSLCVCGRVRCGCVVDG